MRGRRGRLVWTLVLALWVIPVQPVAAATGPYTVPAWEDPGESRGYGCVSGTTSPWEGTNADGTSYDCNFHGGIDFLLDFEPVVSTRGGTVIKVVEEHPDNPGSACASQSTPGNLIVISHADGQYSRYLHLTQKGSVVVENQVVSAGQRIGTSGNSGHTCGKHLHYTLSSSATSGSPPYTLNPGGKWTTTSRRAPWLDDYVSKQATTLYLCYGDTVTTWVKFKNLGGRPWPWMNDYYSRGKVILYSTNSTGTAAATSVLQASDWETSSRITPADTASVAADGTGTFTFGVKGGGAPGLLYALYANLDAFGLNQNGGFWFKYNHQVRINVQMLPSQGCL